MKWRAEVARIGRRRWSVLLTNGLSVYGPNGGCGWMVYGSRERAAKKAAKELRRYQRQFSREFETFTVEGDR